MGIHRLTILVTAVAVLAAADAHAATFNVNPIRVQLSKQSTSALITVRNTSASKMRFQVKAFKWSQNVNGAVELRPTNDVVFYPKLLTLPSGGQRKLRVGVSKGVAGNLEKTYRILVEEMPAPRTKNAKKPAGIQILTRMSIPVFVQPAKPSQRISVPKVRIAGGKFSFTVANSGRAHSRLLEVSVLGSAKGGKTLFRKKLPAWYLLAKGRRNYEMELPAKKCTDLERLNVEVRFDSRKVTRPVAVAPTMCPDTRKKPKMPADAAGAKPEASDAPETTTKETKKRKKRRMRKSSSKSKRKGTKPSR